MKPRNQSNVPARERATVRVKRTTDSSIFTIVGPDGSIQRRERKFMPSWALKALITASTIEAPAIADHDGRWRIDRKGGGLGSPGEAP